MTAIIALLIILTLSILITRVAAIALTHTGLSRESSRFQARSAFTGVGFTTEEAEKVVNHPVRRRVLMLLMLLGNAGIVSAISSLALSFVGTEKKSDWFIRIGLLVFGVSLLWMLAQSQWLDHQIATVVRKALKRWTNLDIRDYAGLLQLRGDYQVMELKLREDDWVTGRTLANSRLRREGILVLGIETNDGGYLGAPEPDTELKAGQTLILYGRSKALHRLDERRRGIGGELSHAEAVAEQHRVSEEEQREVQGGEQEEVQPRRE